MRGMATPFRASQKHVAAFGCDFRPRYGKIPAYLIIKRSESDRGYFDISDNVAEGYLLVVVLHTFISEHLHIYVLVDMSKALCVCLQYVAHLLVFFLR